MGTDTHNADTQSRMLDLLDQANSVSEDSNQLDTLLESAPSVEILEDAGYNILYQQQKRVVKTIHDAAHWA